jgi:Ca2+-binding RTX toxin-like protein
VIDTNGFDTVIASSSYRLGRRIENLSLTGDSPSQGAGNGLNNVLRGNSANNSLDGQGGNDNLFGNGGIDTLTGAAGQDRFAYTNPIHGLNIITDFSVTQDKIQISRSGFGLAAEFRANGSLPAAAFVLGSSATNASTRFIYDAVSGILSFDQDGNGGAMAIALVLCQEMIDG